MIGGDGAGGFMIVFLLFLASVFLTVPLLLGGTVLFFLKYRRASAVLLSLGLAIVLLWGGVYWWFRPPTPKDYTVVFGVTPERTFAGLPGGRVLKTGDATNHQIWGHLMVDITLPDGRKIVGKSDRLSVTTRGSLVTNIFLFYEPASPGSVWEYWREGDHPSRFDEKDRILVDRGLYSVDMFHSKGGSYCLAIEFPPSALSKTLSRGRGIGKG